MKNGIAIYNPQPNEFVNNSRNKIYAQRQIPTNKHTNEKLHLNFNGKTTVRTNMATPVMTYQL